VKGTTTLLGLQVFGMSAMLTKKTPHERGYSVACLLWRSNYSGSYLV